MKMTKTGLSQLDPSSFSRPGSTFTIIVVLLSPPVFWGYLFSELAVVTNISITLGVNFGNKIFSGTADLTVKKVQPDVNEIVMLHEKSGNCMLMFGFWF